MIKDTSDTGARLPSDGGGPVTPRPSDGFTVRWRQGIRTESDSADGPSDPADDVVDLRVRIDLSDRRRWTRDAGREVLERVVFRLVGDPDQTRAVVDQVVTGSDMIDPKRAVTEVLGLVLEHQGPLGEVRILRVEGVPFADHRRRLCRELLRWPAASRVALTLRHLAELDLDEVAAIMDWGLEDVREIVVQWWPEDGTDRDSPLRHLDPLGPPERG